MKKEEVYICNEPEHQIIFLERLNTIQYATK